MDSPAGTFLEVFRVVLGRKLWEPLFGFNQFFIEPSHAHTIKRSPLPSDEARGSVWGSTILNILLKPEKFLKESKEIADAVILIACDYNRTTANETQAWPLEIPMTSNGSARDSSDALNQVLLDACDKSMRWVPLSLLKMLHSPSRRHAILLLCKSFFLIILVVS